MKPTLKTVLVLIALIPLPTLGTETLPHIELGLSYGGDTLTPAFPGSHVKAGSGIRFLFGIETFMSRKRESSLIAGIGLRANMNGPLCLSIICLPGASPDAYFDAFIIDAIYQFKIGDASDNNKQHWLGVGISHHVKPEYQFNTFFGFVSGEERFDDVTAYLVQYSLKNFSEKTVSIGGRYTQVEFESANLTVDGSNLMLFINASF